MAPRMQRVALILLLFILLMNGRHTNDVLPAAHASFTVTAKALPIDEAGDPAKFGPLRLTGAWHLSGSHPAFGGISSLIVGEDGGVIALNDTGELFRFHLMEPQSRGSVEPLPRTGREQSWPARRWDSESMQRDPVSGRIWVGFELIQRICRYAPDFKKREGCLRRQPDLQRWPLTGSLESLVRFSDGRFMAISEMGIAAGGGHDVLLWQGDPVDPRTPPPVHLSYRPPTGFRPTDAVWLGGDKLLVLNRRLTLAEGFTARLSLVTLPRLAQGAKLEGKVIASFAPPGLADNFEALALSHDHGRPLLWIASDDNHLFLQRTLLLRFALPEDWVSEMATGRNEKGRPKRTAPSNP